MNRNVTILSFSARENGNCARISDYIAKFYMRTNVFCFKITADQFEPCGKCDYQCLRAGQECPNLSAEQQEIMDRICGSDIVYYIVPNYCGYPCANYFAFNERSVGYFSLNKQRMDTYMNIPKRFIAISNSEGFEEAMQQQTFATPDIIYLKSRKYQKQSISGDLLESEAVKEDQDSFLRKHQL